MSPSILIQNGTVVNDDQMFEADVLIEKGLIKKVGKNLKPEKGVKCIDAKGKYVIPGGIDTHTHFEFPFMGTMSADDYYTGTRAALAGGTTMIMNFMIDTELSLLEGYKKYRTSADATVCCDYSFHVGVTKWNEQYKKEVEILAKEKGVNSFKVFMAYKDALMLNDSDIIDVFKTCKKIGALPQIHCENGDIIAENQQVLLKKGVTGPEGHLYSRPEEVEAEATLRATVLANQVNCPLYIVHVMSKTSADIIARNRQMGHVLFGEAITAALGVNGSNVFHKCWRHAAAHVMAPPIRTDTSTQDYLLNMLANGDLQAVGTDHCVFNSDQKKRGINDFTKIPNGVNGVEERMSLVWEKGVHSGKMDPCKYVAITSTNAAKIFNIYPQKGRIAEGSDADVVVWDPTGTKTFSVKDHHAAVDFNVFEGMEVRGIPSHVITRGVVAFENGKLTVVKGSGKYIPTPTYSPMVYDRISKRETLDLTPKVERDL